MTNKSVIQTENAPQAIGTYSQAVKAGDTVYLSGQIPLDPATMEVVAGDFATKTRQVFENLKAVCEAAGGELKEDRKSTRLNSSHVRISYAVFCLKKKKKHTYIKNTSHTRALALNC